jgi:hypothetical protein
MGTRIVFVVIALLAVGWLLWAYHHDRVLRDNAPQLQLGDPQEAVRDLLGTPTSEGDCGSLTAVPNGCSHEFVYRYAFSLFNAQYQVIWFDSTGKMLGETRVGAP